MILLGSIFRDNIFIIFLFLVNLIIFVVLTIFYIKFISRKSHKYDYEKRNIRGLSLAMILGFGLTILLFIIVIGIFLVKIVEIDNYKRNHKSHVIHFSEYTLLFTLKTRAFLDKQGMPL